MIRSLRTGLRLLNVCRYSTEKKNIFILRNNQDLPKGATTEVIEHIGFCQSCNMLAVFLKDNLDLFVDLTIAQLYRHLAQWNLELDDSFDSIIVPISVQFINSFTRNHGTSLGVIAICAAKLKTDNQILWEALFNKLHNQGIYRYLTLLQTLELLETMIQQKTFINHPLVAKLQEVVTQHKAYYIQVIPDMQIRMLSLSRKIEQSSGQKPLRLTEAYQMIQ